MPECRWPNCSLHLCILHALFGQLLVCIYQACFFPLLFWTQCFAGEDDNGSYILPGVQLLMEMLFERSSSGNSAEVAACERVQQKSAVTLARLSRDPEVADAAVKLSCKDVSLA